VQRAFFARPAEVLVRDQTWKLERFENVGQRNWQVWLVRVA
jgi:hypothetical protein